MAKQPISSLKGNGKGFEESLWDTANKLRGTVESSEYKHVILSLIFLKFASDKFADREQELIDEGKEAYLDMVEFYTMKNVFYLPEEARWLTIQINAKQPDIALKVDTALATLEKHNKALRGALPDNYFSRLGLDPSKLAALIDTISNIDTTHDQENDVVGRVYEYFLGKFAAAEGKLGGEFYTPKCVVNLIAEMIEPYKGKIYDPCCGSGGMFVQSVKFVQSHHGNQKDISIYGQENTGTTYKLAKMNLAIRGIAGNLGDVPADTFFKDQHPDLKADFIMANPPFNLKDWRGADELTRDPRWAGYEVPPTGNANYAWILHMIAKLSANGVAGFVMANGSMSTNTNSEGEIRRKIIENDLVDCMIALPGQLFYTTQIPVCLWFLSKSKQADSSRDFRNRQGETLFIDARNLGSMVDRTHKELTSDDIAEIARTYHAWRGEKAVTDSLEKEVVAFLNTHEGGTIYLGVNDKGETVGIQSADQTQLALKDRLKNNIRPSCFGLFEIVLEHADGKDILRINIASGSEKPYYIKHFGMAEKGCFIRVGSAAEPMPTAMIERLFSRRTRNTIGMMRSPRGDLTFKLLKLYYQEGGYDLNPSFLTNLELKTPEGEPNYAAYLLADENGVSIKVAKYAGTTRVDLTENSEYGYCSLIKAVNRVLEKLEIENRTFAKITPRKRLERRMIDPTALREAVINAVIHNDYSNGAPPKVELFSDRVEITSMGGLPYGVTQEDFFAGISAPRNKELMRVFRDLELVEHLGSGVPRILKAYDTSVFEIRESYLRVTFPYREGFESDDNLSKTSGKTSGKILMLMAENAEITIPELASAIGITERSIERNIQNLQKSKKIERIGSAKGGHWEVLDHE